MTNINIKDVVKKYRTGQISRRELGRIMGMLGIVGVTNSIGGKMASAATEMSDRAMVFGWAGYDDESLWPSYVAKYGGLPRYTVWGDEEEGVTKLTAGFQPDVIFPCSYKIKKWYQTGMLESLDTSRLKNWNDILPSLRTMPGVVQDGNTVWAPVDWGMTSIAYRTDLAPEYIDNESWSILWDEKYKKRMACFDSLVDGVAIAGIMAGLKNPFDYTSQADLDATRNLMNSMVPNLRFFSNDSTTMEQGLASGELVAATVWNESIVRLKAQGIPIKYMDPKEGGAMTWVCGLSIIAGSKFKDQAYELVDAMLEPDSRAYEIREFGYGVSTQSGFDMVDEATLTELGLSKNPDDILSNSVFQEEIQNEEGLQAMFDEVKAGL
ncbi:MAG: extracellular solute-binding protein [Rhodospirillales bacterium]|jgi:spermidine/putrescine transport system substrate-binding protein|nr:extracellular solute-binding protein [Rhodospirillales bacterium]